MSKKRDIELKHPIEIKNEEGLISEVKTITLRRLKAKDLGLMPKTDSKGNFPPKEMLPLIAGLSNFTKEQVDELDMEDLITIANVFEDLTKGLPSR